MHQLINQKMSSRSPILGSPSQLKDDASRYKFWNSSIAGNQIKTVDRQLVEAAAKADDEQQQQQQNDDGRLPQSQYVQNEQDWRQKQQQYKQKIQNLQDELSELKIRMQQSRVLNQNIVKQLGKTTNQLKASQAMNAQLNIQCDKLYTTVKNAHDRHSQVQNQKMALLMDISSLNQQKQLSISKCEILQDQVQYLNKKLESMHEENAFQKGISNDLRKQILLLKEELSKILGVMEDYSQLQMEVARTHNINSEIQKKVKNLEQELRVTRVQVEHSEISEEKYREEQNKLFLKVQQLQNQTLVLKQRLLLTEQDNKVKQKLLQTEVKSNDYEARYVKVLREYQARNQNLIFQIMALNERNHRLIDERDFYMRRVEAAQNGTNERLPYDQFVSILKSSDADVQNLKRILYQKEEQIEQGRSRYEEEKNNLRQKIQEVNSLLKIKQKQMQGKDIILNNQIQIYKKECELSNKRNQQLKYAQVKLRLEVSQKDRLIISLIQKQKAQQQIRRREVAT